MNREPRPFRCPYCGCATFTLSYRPQPSAAELAALVESGHIPAAGAALVGLFADNSPLYAECSADACNFATSVTEVTLSLTPD